MQPQFIKCELHLHHRCNCIIRWSGHVSCQAHTTWATTAMQGMLMSINKNTSTAIFTHIYQLCASVSKATAATASPRLITAGSFNSSGQPSNKHHRQAASCNNPCDCSCCTAKGPVVVGISGEVCCYDERPGGRGWEKRGGVGGRSANGVAEMNIQLLGSPDVSASTFERIWALTAGIGDLAFGHC